MPCDNSKASSEIEHVEWSTGTGSGHHYTNVRFGSSSSQASQSSGDICRICHCESDPLNPLLTPCYCSGSLKYVHQTCLQQWLTASETNSCELCKFPFIMHTKIKPFNEWRSLDISGIERRRLCCSVLFHCAGALCVIWSLCVLIERAADDVQHGLIDWPFWTKLAVVTVGLTGGIVFMYLQCKAYLHLCHRWKARNRILLIQNAPEKIHPVAPPSPAIQNRANRLSATNAEAHSSLAGNIVGMACAEISGNITQSSTGYDNYAPQLNTLGTNPHTASAAIAAASPRFLASSPHHMLDDADLDMNSHGALSLSSDVQHLSQQHHHHHHGHSHAHGHHMENLANLSHGLNMSGGHSGQVAVAANIECTQSQQNYERDWALDDVVSQISSFRPCPQGSGSMTPFHDSIHNVLEHSEDSSRISTNDLCAGSRQDLSADCISSDTGREHALQLSSFSAGSGDHKAPSISSGVSHAVANGLGGFVYKPHTKRYSNSSIFLENRDILNDSVTMGLESTSTASYDYSKADYNRHSQGILTPPPDNGDTYFGRDLRRHSDTKLLGSVEADVHDPMLVYNHMPEDYAACANNRHEKDDDDDEDDNNDDDANILPGHSMSSNCNTDSDTATCKRIRHLLKQHSAHEVDTVIDMELPTSPLFPPPAAFKNPTSNQGFKEKSQWKAASDHQRQAMDQHFSHHQQQQQQQQQQQHPEPYQDQQYYYHHHHYYYANQNDYSNCNQQQKQRHRQKQALRHSLDLIDSSGGIYANEFHFNQRHRHECDETPEYVNGFIAKQYREQQQQQENQQQLDALIQQNALEDAQEEKQQQQQQQEQQLQQQQQALLLLNQNQAESSQQEEALLNFKYNNYQYKTEQAEAEAAAAAAEEEATHNRHPLNPDNYLREQTQNFNTKQPMMMIYNQSAHAQPHQYAHGHAHAHAHSHNHAHAHAQAHAHAPLQHHHHHHQNHPHGQPLNASHHQPSDLSKVFFKSLPNLSSNPKLLLNK